MTTKQRDQTEEAMATAVADHIRRAMVQLHQLHGIPLHSIAVGTHAQAVAALNQIVGPDATAQLCDRAARTIRTVKRERTKSLAFAAPAGRA